MWRMVFRFILVAVLAAGFAWLADRPGTVEVDWLGYTIEMPLVAGLIALLLLIVAIVLLWRLLRGLLAAPGSVGGFFANRRNRRGRDALSKGILAVGAGDLTMARRHADLAARILPDEPLARLLKAQTAQLKGDRATARAIFEEMTENPETEALGLRGLFNQARQDGDYERARRLAERAVRLNPQLDWASSAMLAIHSAESDWPAVARLVDTRRRNGQIDAKTAARRKAVIATAQAVEMEESRPEEALEHALSAHKLAPDLVPAAVVASRLHARNGDVRKAMRVIERTWRDTPHRDLAEAYAHVRPGDSAQDRLKRVRSLVARRRGEEEGAIALARAAIEARDWALARSTLKPLVDDRPSVTVCSLMAEIEFGEYGDKGKVREWLARAVHAPRDPAWTADGQVSETWLPVSPVTGELDAFSWRRPVEGLSDDRAPDAFLESQIDRAPEPALPADMETDVIEVAPAPAEPPAAEEPKEKAPPVAVAPATAEEAPAAPEPEPQPVEEPKPEPKTTAQPEEKDQEKPKPASVAPPPPADGDTVRPADTGAVIPLRQPDDPGPDETGTEDRKDKSWLGGSGRS